MIVLFSTDPIEILTAVPIVVYAYTCHPNILPIFLELKKASPRRMNKVVTRAIGSAFLLYVSLGIFAYLTFKTQLAHSNGNFLLNDYHGDPMILCGAIGIGISITFALPLFVNAFRSVAYTLVLPLIDDEHPIGSEARKIPLLWHWILSIGMVVAAVVPAVSVADISKIFTVLGATTNPVICFIFPAMFVNRAVPAEMYVTTKRMATFLAVFIPAISLSSLAYQICQWHGADICSRP